MPAFQDIATQQARLDQHRANVATLLEQIAGYGGLIHAPLNLRNTLTQNRTEIARVKAILRDWGVEVADHPDDEASAAPVAAYPGQALHQLRAPVADFVGRDDAVARLVGALRTGSGGRAAAISGVRGMGGIGKTELAYAVAAQLQDDYPDAQLLLELQGFSDAPLSPQQVLQQVIRAFHPDEKLPEELDALQARYRSVLAGRRVLIMADDARDGAQIRPLQLPAGSALLVTSRQRFVLDGMAVLDLDCLDEAAAVQLLSGICDRLDEDQARQLAALYRGLPLALRISAGILANDPSLSVARYLTQFADERHRLALLRDPDDPVRNVAATLYLSYAALDQHTQMVFRWLGVLAANANLGLITKVLEQGEEEAEAVLRLLLRRSLVEYDAARDRWGLHDLVRVFALERLTEAGEERAARQRYADQVILILEEPNWDYADAGDREKHIVIGDFEQWLTIVRTINYRLGERNVLQWLGRINADYGEWRRAIDYYEQYLVLVREEVANRLGEGRILNNIGSSYMQLDDANTALEYFEQCLFIMWEQGERVLEGVTLGNLGNTLKALHLYHEAHCCFEQQLHLFQQIGNPEREAMALDNMGTTHYLLENFAEALTCCEASLVLAQKVGNQRLEGVVLRDLANVQAALGRSIEANANYQASLALLDNLTDSGWGSYTRWAYGQFLIRQGERERGIDLMAECVAYEQRIGYAKADEYAALVELLRAGGELHVP